MILSGIGKRYAVALFNAASNQDVAEQVEDDINGFANLFKDDTRFRNFLMSPMVLTEDKKNLLQTVLGDRASGLFVKFVMLLIDKKRLGKVGDIATAYTYLHEQQQGIIEVRCVTAIPLSHDLQLKTRQVIEERTGKQVRLFPSTDPDIIGGMILFVEDKIIDGSLRHELSRIRKELGELKVH